MLYRTLEIKLALISMHLTFDSIQCYTRNFFPLFYWNSLSNNILTNLIGIKNRTIWSFLSLLLWLVHVWLLWPSMSLKKDRKVDLRFRNTPSTKKWKRKKKHKRSMETCQKYRTLTGGEHKKSTEHINYTKTSSIKWHAEKTYLILILLNFYYSIQLIKSITENVTIVENNR